MIANTPTEDDEAPNDSRLLGLIGAMKDGWVESFEHRGVFVHRTGESIGISPTGPPQDIVGGRHLLESGSINETAEWINEKVDHYVQ